MRCEHDRFQAGIFTFPGIKQAVFIDKLTGQLGMHLRIKGLEEAVQRQKCAGIHFFSFMVGDRFALHSQTQALRHILTINFNKIDLIRFFLRWGIKHGFEGNKTGQEDQQDAQTDANGCQNCT